MAELQEILIANLTLDTYRKNNIPPLVVPKGDYGARVIRVMITEQGKAVTVKERDAVYIVAERSGDGASEAFSGKVNKDGSVTVPITQWMLDIPVYDVICHVVVTGNGYQYSTNSFLIEPQSKENPTELSEDDPRKNVVDELLAKDSAIQADLENVKQRTAGVEQRAVNLEKRVTNLEHGMMSDTFETDDSVAYIKDVPTKALPYAAVSKVGGMTYRSGNSLRSAPVTEVKSVGANRAFLVNGKHNLDNRIDLTVNNGHIEISTAMYEDYFYDKWKPYTTLFLKAGTYNFSLQNRALDYDTELGAFEVNILDAATNTGIVNLSSNLSAHDNWDFVIDKDKEVYIASYTFNSTGKTITFSFDIMISKGSGRKDFIEPVVHTLPIPAEVQALDGYGEGNPDNIGEHNYIDFERKIFVSCGHIVSGAWTGYHTMQETDISDVLSYDNLIGVEGGGDITMVNEHEYAVPSEIIYQLKGV